MQIYSIVTVIIKCIFYSLATAIKQYFCGGVKIFFALIKNNYQLLYVYYFMTLLFCITLLAITGFITAFTALPGKRCKTILPVWIYIVVAAAISSCQSTTQKTAAVASKDSSITPIELPQPQPIAKAEAEKIRKACQLWYDSTLSLKGFNGGVIVAKNGNIVFEKYSGTVHLPGTDIITANTPLHIASVSKTFTAMAVLKLWQDGKLNIDDELSKYITSFNYPGVTIRSLLNHRSGLPNYTYFMDNLTWDKTKTVTNEEVLNFLNANKATLQNLVQPNTHFSYCNTNFALLALVIENVTGKKYPEYMQQTFFAPLQMKNTFVYSNNADSLKVAPSYDWKERLIHFNFLDGVYGDKNIYTTPQDLLTWDRFLNSKKIFTEETLAQAYTPYSNEKPGIKNYGLGWRMNIYPDGKKMIFHNGWWHGSNACFIRLLKENATIIVIGNKFTRGVYGAKILCNLFGDYYTPEEDEENESAKATDSLSALKPGNINLPANPLNKKDSKLQEFFKDKNKVKTNL
jgi:CubicO group peptidase (beta-lactamase class C family)